MFNKDFYEMQALGTQLVTASSLLNNPPQSRTFEEINEWNIKINDIINRIQEIQARVNSQVSTSPYHIGIEVEKVKEGNNETRN